MKELINYQIIHDPSGQPAFVVVPYHEFQRKFAEKNLNMTDTIPADVVDLCLEKGYSAVRGWREYLGLTQIEVAQRLGISQSAYSQHENATKLTKGTRAKIANALGIYVEQLDF